MRYWIVASLVCVCALGAFAEAPKLEPATLTMAVGEKKILTVTPEAPLTFEAFDATTVSVDPARLTVTALKPGTVTLIGKNADGEKSNEVKVTVTAAEVKLPELEKIVMQGETRTIALPATIGELAGPFTLKSTNEKIATVAADSKAITGNAVTGDQSVKLNVLANGLVVGTATATVREAIARIEADLPFEIVEGTSKDLNVKLVGAQGSKFTPEQRALKATVKSPVIVSASDTGVVQANILRGEQAASTVVELSSAEGDNNKTITLPVTVNVLLGAGSIISDAGTPFLPRDGRVLIAPTMRDRKGEILPITQIKWVLKDPANDKFVTLSPSDKSLLVFWKDGGVDEAKRPNFVEITVNALSDKGAVISDTLVVRMTGEIEGFAPLKVRLNIMDNQTATDLYGKVTANEYFVTRVRLNNNLSASTDRAVQGGSILAFSESIEVAVQYEKRELDKGKPKKNAEWTPVTPEDLVDFEDGPNDARASELHVDPRCKGFITYRPYMFEMMVNSVDRRDERSARSKTLRTLQAVGTLASVVTSVAVPGAQSDFPLAIEKYNSLFLPGFEKLWPTLRETNRQNLVSQTMKTIEEIPFGSDLARVLFFPKREFRGLLAKHETRVARICPYHFDIEVAVIQKKQAVRAGQ